MGTLQVGVIGMGPVWRRWLKPALLAAPDQYRIVLVADQNRRRADDEAAELRCPSSPSAGRLIRHAEVDVLVLGDSQWHGLWALEEALKLGKPVLSAVPLGAEPAAFTRLEPMLHNAERCVYFVEALSAPGLVTRVRELQQGALGPLTSAFASAETGGWAGLARVAALVTELTDGSNQSVQSVGRDAREAAPRGIALEGKTGWTMYIAGARESSSPRLRLRTERGSASLRWPSRLLWQSGAAQHRERLTRESVLPAVLQHFHALVWSGQCDEDSQRAALENGRLMYAALRSFENEGKRFMLAS